MDKPSSSKDSTPAVEHKKEPLSAAEEQAEILKAFHETSQEKVKQSQGMELDTRTMLQALQKKAWTDQLQDGVRKHQGRIAAILKILNKSITEPLGYAQYDKLKVVMQTVLAMDIELKEAAQGFGIKPTKKARKV